jgi:hypothetical protein
MSISGRRPCRPLETKGDDDGKTISALMRILDDSNAVEKIETELK